MQRDLERELGCCTNQARPWVLLKLDEAMRGPMMLSVAGMSLQLSLQILARRDATPGTHYAAHPTVARGPPVL